MKRDAFPLPVWNPPFDSQAERPHWRSLEAFQQPPADAQAQEFPVGAAELSDGVARRTFLQLLGSSLAVAGLGACNSPPAEKILPYSRRPEDVVPGRPLHFATADVTQGIASGLLVTSWEGRPTKIEGNPDHPASLGASTAQQQAELMQLYDPHRARGAQLKGQPQSGRTFLAAMSQHAQRLQADGGAGLRFLVEPSSSPLVGDLRQRLLSRFPNARFHAYDPLSRENVYEGARIAFGQPLEPVYELKLARVVLLLDSDLFDTSGPHHLRYARDFATSRAPGEQMSRLYVVEPTLSVSGTLADHRLRLKSQEVERFAQAVLSELASLGAVSDVLRTEPDPRWAKWVKAVAADLLRHRGRGLVVAGPRQSASVHALANAINGALGNLGSTVEHYPPALHDVATGPGSMRELAASLERGEVDTLVITAFNPVYTAPADLDFKALLGRAKHTVYLGTHVDETAQACAWFAPKLHALESWGDARSVDGTACIVQPLISPLWGGFTEAELFATWIGQGDKKAYELVKAYWRARAGGDFEMSWERWLSKGLIDGTASQGQRPSVLWDQIRRALAGAPAPAPAESLELNFVRDDKVHDGRYANNAWLQELPHPVSKLTWDNAAYVSPATARSLEVETGQVVRLESRGRQLEIPVLVLPGQADGTVTVSLGYGRNPPSETVARNVGFNAYALRHSEAPWFDAGVQVSRVKRRHKLAITQEHGTMADRPIALEATFAELKAKPEALEKHRGELPALYDAKDYKDEPNKWAMAVDLNSCMGCNACVVACQAENNIPVVGKPNVLVNREMHWLRIDRYFTGDADDPGVMTQPMMCQHCEAAPCEYVCPVNATVHSDEGLNEMVYNRCIGTRYCSNNCPYKVRRFNFVHYNANKGPVERMASNPDVTVRARGVMEKCTYCVQRIERARIDARIEGRPLRDGEFTTACAQACPTNAIVFGSLNDPTARVTKLHADARRYDVLHELGTRPRTAYLVRVRNPNPELA